jgi:hypothetical protein
VPGPSYSQVNSTDYSKPPVKPEQTPDRKDGEESETKAGSHDVSRGGDNDKNEGVVHGADNREDDAQEGDGEKATGDKDKLGAQDGIEPDNCLLKAEKPHYGLMPGGTTTTRKLTLHITDSFLLTQASISDHASSSQEEEGHSGEVDVTGATRRKQSTRRKPEATRENRTKRDPKEVKNATK